MTQTLTEAHEQLFTRPPEERFASWKALRHDAAAQRARSREVAARDCEIEFHDDDTVAFNSERLRSTRDRRSAAASPHRMPE